MKRIIGLSFLSAGLFLAACGTKQPSQNEANENTVKDSAKAMSADSTAKTFTVAMVDNKKDPTCGMPVTAGIGDTTHYDGHVIGFCSKECKDEFLKNPKAGLAAAELKK